jgi:hypothetical protein
VLTSPLEFMQRLAALVPLPRLRLPYARFRAVQLDDVIPAQGRDVERLVQKRIRK